MLQKSGNDLANYSNMPSIPSIWRPIPIEKPNQLLNAELSSNLAEQLKDLKDSLLMLNSEQKTIQNTIISRLNQKQYGNNAFFILQAVAV